MKGAILRFVHRAVDVILAFAFVPARGIPRNIHVDAIMIDNRRNRIEESETVFAGLCHDALGEVCCGQWAGGDDDWAVGWNDIHALTDDFDVRLVFQMLGNGLRENVAIDGERGPCGYLGHFGGLHDKRTQIAHFLMQKANGIVFGIV